MRGVHQRRHGPARIEGTTELGGHLQREGMAFDQSDRPPVLVDHTDSQGIGLGPEALEHIRPWHVGPNRLGDDAIVPDPGHTERS